MERKFVCILLVADAKEISTKMESNTEFSFESSRKTLSTFCQLMKQRKLHPFPLCTTDTPANLSQLHTDTADTSQHNQDMFQAEGVKSISLGGFLAGAFFILFIITIVTWKKGSQSQVISYKTFESLVKIYFQRPDEDGAINENDARQFQTWPRHIFAPYTVVIDRR